MALDYALQVAPESRTPRVLRRLLLWSVICIVSAAPSFLFAQNEFDTGGMVLGVALFIALYTVATSTDAFERFHARPFVRRTLYIGYGLRLGISIVYPIGMGADMLPGMLSVGLVENLGLPTRQFAGTLAVTIVQGAILNVVLSVFMLAVYHVMRATMKPPPERARKGFEVVLGPPRVLQAQPIDAPPAAPSAPGRADL